MADGLSQPPPTAGAAARRGPPPLPRAAIDSALNMPVAVESPVDELLALVAAEAETLEAVAAEKRKLSPVGDGSDFKAKKRAADLKVRPAMLAWDGRGDLA